jgi:hypothetical protein
MELKNVVSVCVLNYAGKGRKNSRRRKLNDGGRRRQEFTSSTKISIRRNIKKNSSQSKTEVERELVVGGIVLLFSLVEKERRR